MSKSTPVPPMLLEVEEGDQNCFSELPLLERQHVQQVYDAVAHEWHGTRYKAWPRVVEFVSSLPARSLVADVGCGNGKLAPAFRAMAHLGIGCDFSAALVRIAVQEMRLEAQVADALMLPYRTAVFDAAVCIAVLHHVTTPIRRRQLICEVVRVLRPHGRALFYAWAHEQQQGCSGHEFDTQDVFVPFHKRNQKGSSSAPPGSGREGCIQSSQASVGSAAIPSQGHYDQEKDAFVFQRYCHVYRRGELTELVSMVPGACVLDEYYDVGNWCALVEKAG